MDVLVTCRRCTITEELRDKVTRRIQRVERFKDRVIRVEVQFASEPHAKQPDQSTSCEITVLSKGPVVRAEASAEDQLTAFDRAMERLKTQLRRAADRRKSRRGLRKTHFEVHDLGEAALAEPEVVEQPKDETRILAGGLEVTGDGPLVVREKFFTSTPHTLAQALDEMELVGHDFFLYVDAETGLPSVVYRRKAYDYGVIHLETTSAE